MEVDLYEETMATVDKAMADLGHAGWTGRPSIIAKAA
jgi:hypothetical protein